MGEIRIDLTGQRFGRLLVKSIVPTEPGKKKKWLCECDCGQSVIVAGSNLRSGHSTGCKVCQLKTMQQGNITHGESDTKLYRVWHAMLNRCENPKDKSYPDYGGRGISVCEEWHDPGTFLLWAHSHGYCEGVEIDRIDNDASYSPDNCHWVPKSENALNKRNNKVINHDGATRTLAQWARFYGINYKSLWKNLSKGYSFEEAVCRVQTGDKMRKKVTVMGAE